VDYLIQMLSSTKTFMIYNAHATAGSHKMYKIFVALETIPSLEIKFHVPYSSGNSIFVGVTVSWNRLQESWIILNKRVLIFFTRNFWNGDDVEEQQQSSVVLSFSATY
jgi:hypothetical protein